MLIHPIFALHSFLGKSFNKVFKIYFWNKASGMSNEDIFSDSKINSRLLKHVASIDVQECWSFENVEVTFFYHLVSFWNLEA